VVQLLQRDFTLSAYREIIAAAKRARLDTYGVLHWTQLNPKEGLLIRHDVDRRPANALVMAELEAEMGVFTTYYFRVVGSSMNPSIIRSVSELGHEIGYHYEDLALAGGDFDKALSLFRRHLEQLRAIAPIKTIAMHGSPLSPHNNLDLWRSRDLKELNLEAEAFLTVDYMDCLYLTDTGRSWSEQSVNLRDHPPGAKLPPPSVTDTHSLVRLIESGACRRIAISAHPERWDDTLPAWTIQWGKDLAANAIKALLQALRRRE
jgi:hypothetical protein